EMDLHAFGGEGDARMVNDLMEAFADPLFDAYQLTSSDLRDLTANHPQVARAVIALYSSYKTQRASSEELASRLEGEEAANTTSLLPSEEVNDLVQTHMNYFPDLEDGAEELWKRARLE
ncbi:MAG: XRE family transcriptional regulator, partial [Polyangiaceae bacterium]